MTEDAAERLRGDEFHQEAMQAIRTFTDDVERDTQGTFTTMTLEGIIKLFGRRDVPSGVVG